MKKFILGIPNPGSSLFDATMELLRKIGISVSYNGRGFEGKIEGTKLFEKVFLMRPQDIPSAIDENFIDCGICGWDCVVEAVLEDRLTKIVELNYSKKTNQPARIVVFSKHSSELATKLITKNRISVTTEYPNIAKKFFKDVPEADIVFSHGTTEAKVVAGMFDFGVGVTESGDSIRDNGLNIVAEILVSPTVFIAKTETPELKIFGEMLAGALHAKKFHKIKMNVSMEKKEKVLAILPSLRSPTINSLVDGGFSIETVVEISAVGDLLFELKMIGVTAILGNDVNYIIP
jgi:ATP phosphoribosyltransferase